MKYYNEELLRIRIFYEILAVFVADFGKENLTSAQEKKVLSAVRKRVDDAPVKDKDFFLEAELTYGELIEYFKGKEAELKELEDKRDKENYGVAHNICKDFEAVLRSLERDYEDFTVKEYEDRAELLLIDNSAVAMTFVMENAYCETAVERFSTPLWLEVSEYGDKYCLEAVVCDLFDEEFAKVKFIFASCKVRTEVFKATDTVGFYNPWSYLGNIANALIEKQKYASAYMNSEERDILPLAEALVNIPYSAASVRHAEIHDYEKQKALVDLAKALLIYDDIEKLYKKKKLYICTLCNKKYEGLWRIIYNKLLSSQKDYKVSSEVVCTKEIISQRRKTVYGILNKAGFEGEYPDFYKDGEIMKPKEVNSYGNDLIIAGEKNCRFHIKCIEEGNNIKFICGYVCLGKYPEQYSDAFSACFYDKGRRYFSEVSFVPEDKELKDIINMPSLEKCTLVAVKKAKAEKLDKEEIKQFSQQVFSLKEKIAILIFMSVFSGILFAIGMAGFAVIMEWIDTGSFQQAWHHLREFPWLFTGGGFGVLFSLFMSFTELFRNKK